MDKAEAIARLMTGAGGDVAVQIPQTRYRLRLAETWGLPAGARILEIACGQGDMTAVLADRVGETGRVTAVDIADPTYGAPVSLGESMSHLRSTSLGSRIDARFRFDLLDPAVTFPDDAFDLAVLAHGAWYFSDLDQLRRTLERIRPWAKRLCFAEWDLEPVSFDQIGHLLAILIQGQVELAKTESTANVRTPFSKAELLTLFAAAGWEVVLVTAVDTSGMQDGDWEIDYCLSTSVEEAKALDLPAKTAAFLSSQADTLRSVTAATAPRSLPAYAVIAERKA
jgi:SAM-dependent methyltransferase